MERSFTEALIESLPEVPKADRPKPLYVRSKVGKSEIAEAKKLGWEIIDVRLIQDRAERVRAILEGMEIGSIESDKDDLPYLQLSARVAGMLSVKGSEDKPNSSLGADDIDALLSIGSPDEELRAQVESNTGTSPSKSKPKPRVQTSAEVFGILGDILKEKAP